jgi:hypothetical protein
MMMGSMGGMGRRGGMGLGGAAEGPRGRQGGVDVAQKNIQAERDKRASKKNDEEKESEEEIPEDNSDLYYTVVEVRVTGQARFYKTPPKSEEPVSAGDPTAESQPADGAQTPPADPTAAPPAADAPTPDAPAGEAKSEPSPPEGAKPDPGQQPAKTETPTEAPEGEEPSKSEPSLPGSGTTEPGKTQPPAPAEGEKKDEAVPSPPADPKGSAPGDAPGGD